MNSKAGFDPPFLYAKSFLLLPFTRFRCDELIDITILGFQIGERQYTVAHLDDAVSLAGVAQKFELWVGQPVQALRFRKKAL
ncbi:hypothetical protein [Gemmiger formicilis]|jgi:hypothetical protein|uniref:hypothetical protein n=1 Tax=Gemmiger formicilis TaxID=745368 RepID=UPI0035212638